MKISPQQFHNERQQFLVVDVRTATEYKTLVKIKDSVNVYVEDLIADPQSYIHDLDTPLAIYCNAGNRSTYATQRLRSFGYRHVFVLDGGVYGYQR